MQITIDDKRGFQVDGSLETVVQALAEIIEHLDDNGRALQSVIVDGEEISPDELLASLGSRQIDATGALEVRSADIGTLVRESLSEMGEVLPELSIACHTLAEVLRTASLEEGRSSYDELTGIWRTIKVRQRQIAGGMRINLDEISLQDRSLAEWERELLTVFEVGEKAFEAADAAALSDLISYELAPRAESEEKINELLLNSLQKS